VNREVGITGAEIDSKDEFFAEFVSIYHPDRSSLDLGMVKSAKEEAA